MEGDWEEWGRGNCGQDVMDERRIIIFKSFKKEVEHLIYYLWGWVKVSRVLCQTSRQSEHSCLRADSHRPQGRIRSTETATVFQHISSDPRLTLPSPLLDKDIKLTFPLTLH